MTNIRIHYAAKGDPELEDPELAPKLATALGMTFYEFVARTLDKTRSTIKGWSGKELYVRVFPTDNPMTGACFKSGGGKVPHIVIGFCGDIVDLEITLIHELLHLFRWDEKILDKMAWKIYDRRDYK